MNAKKIALEILKTAKVEFEIDGKTFYFDQEINAEPFESLDLNENVGIVDDDGRQIYKYKKHELMKLKR